MNDNDRNSWSEDEERTGPLDGIRVVEYGRFVTAPFASRLLGDLGADVVKVETGDGDPFRAFGDSKQISAQFLALNRSKKSVSIDPRTDEGRDDMRMLLEWADVFIVNSRPGSMERLGFGYADVSKTNPGIVYCSITGSGTVGAIARRPAYDMVGQALSGLASQFIDDANPRVTGPNLSDSLAGMTAAYGILGALVERERSGQGQAIEIDMISSSLAFIGAEAQIYFETGVSPGPGTRPSFSSSFAIRCSDGKLLGIHLSSLAKFWEGLARALDRPDLLVDERFQTRGGRIANYEALRAELAATMSVRDRTWWLDRFQAEDVPCAPIHRIEDVFDDPELADLQLSHEIGDGSEKFRTLAVPVRYGRTPVSTGFRPPRVGEHTDEVLKPMR